MASKTKSESNIKPSTQFNIKTYKGPRSHKDAKTSEEIDQFIEYLTYAPTSELFPDKMSYRMLLWLQSLGKTIKEKISSTLTPN